MHTHPYSTASDRAASGRLAECRNDQERLTTQLQAEVESGESQPFPVDKTVLNPTRQPTPYLS